MPQSKALPFKQNYVHMLPYICMYVCTKESLSEDNIHERVSEWVGEYKRCNATKNQPQMVKDLQTGFEYNPSSRSLENVDNPDDKQLFYAKISDQHKAGLTLNCKARLRIKI